MTAIRKLLRALKDRASRRDTTRAADRRRAHVAMEHLDHRQLMAVNFTGNVITDFPVTTSPGVVVVRPNAGDPNYKIPQIPSEPGGLNDIVKVSGLQLDAIRVSYDQQLDILSVGLDQPLNQKSNQRVIAGDTDNNLNGATVAPEVQALPIFFEDPGLLGGSETMYVTLDLLNNNNPNDPSTRNEDVVAGITNGIDPNTGIPLPKSYQVAAYSADPARSGFGGELPNFARSSFLANTPEAPGFEFQIRNFALLYVARTGLPLTGQSIVQVAANADSAQDDGISEAAIPFLAFNVGQATVPLPPPPPPPPPPPTPPDDCPVNPPVLVNPHENRHINTAHDGIVRVYLFGTDYFDVTQIVPESVRLGGASPVRPPFFAKQNGDTRLDVTYYFRAHQINLPRGITDAVVTGVLQDGTPFSGSAQVFNRDRSFYSAAANAAQTVRSAISSKWREVMTERRLAWRASVASAASTSTAFTTGVRVGPVQTPRVAVTPAPGTPGATVVTLRPRGATTRITPRPAAADHDAWDQALQAADVSTNRRRPFPTTPSRPALKVDMGGMHAAR